MNPPSKLTVIFADQWRTYLAIVHENQGMPYSYRSVQITLTPEQQELLAPRIVGQKGASDVHETIYQCFLEPTE